MLRRASSFTCSLLLLLLGACVEDGAVDQDEGGTIGTDSGDGDGDGDGDPTGDGDGDSTGDGDGDATGDGDGDPTGDGDGDATGDGDGDPVCSYPLGAVEPMALNEVISPYAWPTAIHGDGTITPLDLFDVPCNTDEVIDWSPHELLVFISIPAW